MGEFADEEIPHFVVGAPIRNASVALDDDALSLEAKQLLAAIDPHGRAVHLHGCDDLARDAFVAVVRQRSLNMSTGTIILITLVIALLGGFSGIGGAPF